MTSSTIPGISATPQMPVPGSGRRSVHRAREPADPTKIIGRRRLPGCIKEAGTGPSPPPLRFWPPRAATAKSVRHDNSGRETRSPDDVELNIEHDSSRSAPEQGITAPGREPHRENSSHQAAQAAISGSVSSFARRHRTPAVFLERLTSRCCP